MARPKLQINEAQVEQLAAINCSYEEAAAVLNCDPRTIQRRYAAVFKKGREVGRMSLKRKMWETAMGGNVAMQIFLSKQLLGYSDKTEVTRSDLEKISTEELIIQERNSK